MSSATLAKPTADVAEIRRALDLLTVPGGVAEIRALKIPGRGKPHGAAGYFIDRNKAAEAAVALDKRKAGGVYLVLNEINPALFARSPDKTADHLEPTTSDGDIIRRRWLPLDLDPTRPAGYSASDDEHCNAEDVARNCAGWLSSMGWPSPILADSGNGAHLLYRIDLPNDEASAALIRDSIAAVAERFTGGGVDVDLKVFNAARIWKLYGTTARKGADMPDRPHRVARLVNVPSTIQAVTQGQLEALAAMIAKPAPMPSTNGNGHGQPFTSRLDVPRWLTERGQGFKVKDRPDQFGRTIFVLDSCPFDSSHGGGGEVSVMQGQDGALAAACMHKSCNGRGWQQFKEAIGKPDGNHYDPPLSAHQGNGKAHQGTAADATSKRDDGKVIIDEWPDPPSDQAFYGLAGEVVSTIEPHSEADPVALLVQSLVAFGSIIGRGAHFRAEADKHYCNLFMVLVGITSKGRKGTSWGQVGRIMAPVDPSWSDKRILGGLSSGEGLIWNVRDPITKQEPIREETKGVKGVKGVAKGKGKIVGYEEVEVDPGERDKRLLVMESEFGAVLKVMAREKNTLSAIIRQAWDTGTLRTLVKNAPARATEAHISIIGHITRDELRRGVAETDMANGVANRFLWVCSRRSKCLPDGGELHKVNLAPLTNRIMTAAGFALGVETVYRDAEARGLWHEVYPSLSQGKSGLLGAATSRAEAQVMRLATVYALLDESALIRVEHLQAALSVWDYCERSAKYIFGSALGDPMADEILKALRENPKGMDRTAIREYFSRNKSAEEISGALQTLLESGLAKREKQETTGRRREVWFALA